jgi:small conductance mechanosensitive channel
MIIKDILPRVSARTFVHNYILPRFLQILLGLLILYICHLLGSYFTKLIHQRTRPADEKTTKQMRVAQRVAGNIVYYGTLVIGVMIILKLFGIETASVIALFGASGLAIGLALQGTLTDLASGILMAMNKTVHIGETVQFDEVTGKVIDFNLLNTTLEDVNTKSILQIPNRRFQDTIFHNLTRQTGVINMFISISNTQGNVNIERVIEIIQKAVQKHPSTLGEASIEVADMSKGSTIINVKVPAKYYPSLQGEIGTHIRIALEKEHVQLSRGIQERFTTMEARKMT